MKIEQKTRIIIILLVLMVVSLICLMLPIILGIKMEVFVYSLLGLIALGLIFSYLVSVYKLPFFQFLLLPCRGDFCQFHVNLIKNRKID
jgi:hypothetical protein